MRCNKKHEQFEQMAAMDNDIRVGLSQVVPGKINVYVTSYTELIMTQMARKDSITCWVS